MLLRPPGTTAFAGGLKASVATLVTAFTPEHCELLVSNGIKRIVFCFDPDLAGQSATDRVSELLDTYAARTDESHTLNGLSGATVKRSVSLPHLVFSFGRKVTLAPATILLDQTGGSSGWSAANLGYDVVQQARPLTINFQGMRIDFGQSK